MQKIVIAMAGLLLTGCPSVSTMGLARTLDKGKRQAMLSPQMYGGVSTEGISASLPQMEMAARFGVTDHFELGFKTWLIGAAVDGKIGLIRSDGQNGVDLALDPGIGMSLAMRGSTIPLPSGVLTLSLPLLIGVNFSGHQLVLGPKVVGYLPLDRDTGLRNALLLSNSVGIALKLGDRFRIMPEVTVMYPVSANTTVADLNGVIYQAGIGLLFDSK